LNKLKLENDELKKQIAGDDVNSSEYKKKRHDVISYANKRGAIIRQTTLDKYNIKCNEENKQYY